MIQAWYLIKRVVLLVGLAYLMLLSVLRDGESSGVHLHELGAEDEVVSRHQPNLTEILFECDRIFGGNR